MDTKRDYKLPLEELLTILEHNGYELSIEQVLEIQSVLLSTSLTKTNLKELKFILTPILAKNDEDQKDIYRIIDSFIAKKTGNDDKEKTLTWWDKFLANKQLVFSVKLAGFVVIILLGSLFYLLNSINPNKPPHHSIDNSIGSYKIPPRRDIGKELKKYPVPNPGDRHNRPPKNSNRLNYIPEFSGHIVPQLNNYNLQMSLVFGIPLGIILSFFIFYERRKKMEEERKKRMSSGSTVSRGEGRERTSLSQQDVKNQFDQVVLEFQERNFLIHKTREFSKIKSNLKKPAYEEEEQIDVKKTVARTARNAGFTTLVRNNDWIERKYLLLSSNKEPGAHMTHLLNYLVSFLRGNKIPIAKYSYTNDINILKDSTGNIKYLEELSYNYADYHLIILDDCHSFFTPDSLLLRKDLVATFQAWTSKSIITPLPLPDWSYLEVQLQNDFIVVPAEIEAIELLSKAIIENSALHRAKLENRIRDIYSVSNFDFHSAKEIRDYLHDPMLFQGVCALAIYPKLKWPLTLALLSAILNDSSKATVTTSLDYDTLLKIARIPWLYTGKLDESLRLELLNYINSKTEIIARETILLLLEEVRPFTAPESMAFKEFEVQYNLNSFFLFAHDQQKYKQYAHTRNEINQYWNKLTEWSLKERTAKGESGLMPLQDSGQRTTVEEFVLKEKEFEKKNITLTKVALVTLPTVLLYILFFIFRPNIVYPYGDFKNVSVSLIINSNDSCQRKPKAVSLFINGKTTEVALKGANNIDTILIKDIRFDDLVNVTLLAEGSYPVTIPFRTMDSVVTLSPDCYREYYLPENALLNSPRPPAITDQQFSGMLNDVVYGKLSASEFSPYLCDYLRLPVKYKVGGEKEKTLSFEDACRDMRGMKRVKRIVAELDVQETTGCIVNISIRIEKRVF